MLSISSFDDNDDDSSLLPPFKTMQSKRYFEDDDDDKMTTAQRLLLCFLVHFYCFQESPYGSINGLHGLHMLRSDNMRMFFHGHIECHSMLSRFLLICWMKIYHMTIQDMGSLPLRCQSGLKLLLQLDFVGLQGLHLLI